MLTGLGVSLFFTLNVIMLTMALWAWDEQPESAFAAALAGFLRWIALLFSIPVIWWLGMPLGLQAMDQLRRGQLSTDLLLLTGVVAAFGYSALSTIRDTGHVYFEVSCVILVLVTLGRWLEASGRRRASEALDELQGLLPETVQRVASDESSSVSEFTIPLDAVQIGDRLRVCAGDRIPTDALLVRGVGHVDEQFFTGESRPVEKSAGCTLLGGTLNLDGDLLVEVTAPPRAGALGRLVSAVRQAQTLRGRYERLADTCSRWFFPVIATIAVTTFVWHATRSGLEPALLHALAVVLIACPCALALATPLAVWSALTSAAARGIVIHGGQALERLAGVTALRFDKTGTLTTGAPIVRRLCCETDEDRGEVQRRAAALTSASRHVFSRAVRSFVEISGPACEAADVESVAGKGLVSSLPGSSHATALGSLRLMEEHKLQLGPLLKSVLTQQELNADGLVAIGWDGCVRGLFVLRDELRDGVEPVLVRCRQLRLDVAVLTGDRIERAAALQAQVGIPVTGALLPEDKLDCIRDLQTRGAQVAMIGDGLNDAPALALADVGIAMGCGTDVTRETADACLLTDDLSSVPWLITHARQTVSTIRWNLFWSFAWNGGGVIVAACGWLHPAVASALMVVSSLMVLGQSLRLREPASARELDCESTDSGSVVIRKTPILQEAMV
jgi:heavy metal translocating P-type ATPase